VRHPNAFPLRNKAKGSFLQLFFNIVSDVIDTAITQDNKEYRLRKKEKQCWMTHRTQV
jgi:hypothetical protein